MTSIRRAESGWTALTLLSLSVTVAALWLSLVAWKPKPAERHVRTVPTLSQSNEEEAARKKAQSRTYDVSPEELGAKSLDFLNSLSALHNVKLVVFRAGKVPESTLLTQVPLTLVVEGSFNNIKSLLKDLESPTSKLAISLVQITSTAGDSDACTATIGLTGFISRVSTHG